MLIFPAFILQLSSKNIDTLIQKLSENEIQNAVRKLKFLPFFVLLCTPKNGYVVVSYNFVLKWQDGLKNYTDIDCIN